MRIIELGRSMGKTSQIVEWLRGKKNRLLLVSENHEASRIGRKYSDIKDQVLSYRQWLDFNGGIQVSRIKVGEEKFCEIGIDNADQILEKLFACPVKVMTFNKSD